MNKVLLLRAFKTTVVAALACAIIYFINTEKPHAWAGMCLSDFQKQNFVQTNSHTFVDAVLSREFILRDTKHNFRNLVWKSYLQIGADVSISFTILNASAALSGNGQPYNFVQISETNRNQNLNNSDHIIPDRSIASMRTNKYLIYTTQNIIGTAALERTTIFRHTSGHELRIEHTSEESIIHVYESTETEETYIVAKISSNYPRIFKLKYSNKTVSLEELVSLSIDAERAYFDVDSRKLIAWKKGLNPKFEILDFATKNSRAPSSVVNGLVTSILDSQVNYLDMRTGANGVTDIIQSSTNVSFNKCDINLNFEKDIFRTILLRGDELTLQSPPSKVRNKSVILLNGGPASHHEFYFNDEIHQLVTLGWRVLRTDYPGSTGYGENYLTDLSASAYTKWAQQVCKDLSKNITQQDTVIIRGHSFGALLPGYLIENCPKLIDEVVLVSPAFGVQDIALSQFRTTRSVLDPLDKNILTKVLQELEKKTIEAILENKRSVKTTMIISRHDPRLNFEHIQSIATTNDLILKINPFADHAINLDSHYLSLFN